MRRITAVALSLCAGVALLTAGCPAKNSSTSPSGSSAPTTYSISGSVSYYGTETVTSGTSYLGVALFTDSALNADAGVSLAASATILASTSTAPVTGNFNFPLTTAGNYYLLVTYSSTGKLTGGGAGSGVVDNNGPLPSESYYIYNTGGSLPANPITFTASANVTMGVIAFNDANAAPGVSGPLTYTSGGSIPSSPLANKLHVWAYIAGDEYDASDFIAESGTNSDPSHFYLTDLTYTSGNWDLVAFYDTNGSGDELVSGDPYTIISGVTPTSTSQGISFNTTQTYSGSTETP